MSKEEVFEVMRHLESIQAIAKHLRGEEINYSELNYERIHSPYNFLALIKSIKIYAKTGNLSEDKIDEIIQSYL